MAQHSRRKLRNSLVVIVGLVSTALAASATFCNWHSPYEAQTSGIMTAAASPTWEPTMAGIQLQQIEWIHPEDEVKTERGKILDGLEASF